MRELNIRCFQQALTNLPKPKYKDQILHVDVPERCNLGFLDDVAKDAACDVITLKAKLYRKGSKEWFEWVVLDF